MHPLSAGVVDLLRKGSLPADHWDWHWGSGFTWEREEEGEGGAGLTGEQQIEAKQQARQQAQQQGGSRSPCRGRRRAALAARLLGCPGALPGPAGPAAPHCTALHCTALYPAHCTPLCSALLAGAEPGDGVGVGEFGEVSKMVHSAVEHARPSSPVPHDTKPEIIPGEPAFALQGDLAPAGSYHNT